MGTPQADRNLITFSLNAGLTMHEPFLHRNLVPDSLCCASRANAPSTLSTSVAGATGPSGSRFGGRGGHCNCKGLA